MTRILTLALLGGVLSAPVRYQPPEESVDWWYNTETMPWADRGAQLENSPFYNTFRHMDQQLDMYGYAQHTGKIYRGEHSHPENVLPAHRAFGDHSDFNHQDIESMATRRQVSCPDGMVEMYGACVRDWKSRTICSHGKVEMNGECVDSMVPMMVSTSTCPDENEDDYYKSFTVGNMKLLSDWQLVNRNLVLDPSMNGRETIKWSQFSRCWWLCYEDYILADYYDEADVKKELVVHVFVAKAAGPPPERFSTSGHSAAQDSKLHFGFLFFDSEGSSAIFFVIHPNAWYPYQHRFKTNSLTEAFHAVRDAIIGAAVGEGIAAAIAAAAASGAAIGSIIPGPGTAAGVVIGTVVGGVIALLGNDYVGDYLRFIG